ncbi:modular serine protease-like [Anastrepha ludens]|uniref:modular serine protease-like n=1 Tax=Anastrepha ludens TaxID=28586 RepID=UPI0023AEFBA7|nr:modular serine protease-like [Anastrepha ludens]
MYIYIWERNMFAATLIFLGHVFFVTSIEITEVDFEGCSGSQCDDGTCIEDTYFCNGFKDCPDGSDESEQMCKEAECANSDFKCSYGACIPHQITCDQKFDCVDGSDETFALCPNTKPCPNTKFQCGYGGCINFDGKCDGKFDCPDQSDEYPPLCQ